MTLQRPILFFRRAFVPLRWSQDEITISKTTKQAGIEKEKVIEGAKKQKFDQSAGIPKLGAFVSFGLRRGRASWKSVKF